MNASMKTEAASTIVQTPMEVASAVALVATRLPLRPHVEILTNAVQQTEDVITIVGTSQVDVVAVVV